MPELELRTLPVLPLKNSVLFPGLMMPLSVGRSASIAAVEAALGTEEKEIIVVAQKDNSVDLPGAGDLYTVGTRAVIRSSKHTRGDHRELIVQGVERVVLVKVDQNGHIKARYRPLPLPDDSTNETEALTLSIIETGSKLVNLVQGQSPQDIAKMFVGHADPLQLAFTVASVLNLDVEKEQSLLETPTRLEGLRMVLGWVTHEVQVAEIRQKVAEEARTEISREQREYVLRQQKKAIEQELGEQDSGGEEVESLKEKLAKADLPEDVRKEAERELSRLEKVNSASPDHHVAISSVAGGAGELRRRD